MNTKGKIEDYLSQTLGWKVNFEELGLLTGKIPYGLAGAASYFIMKVEGLKGVVIKPREEDDFSSTKRLAISIGRILGLPPVLILERLDSHQRQSLIKDRINFIVQGKQIYLPSIGVLLNERGLGQSPVMSNSLTPLATAVIVFVLSKHISDELTITEMAEKMGYSVKSMSLAAAELERFNLLSVRQEGRRKFLKFLSPFRELWDKAYPLAINPIEKKVFTDDAPLAEVICDKASDTALSEVSMLAPPRREVFAIYARNPRLKELDLNPVEGAVSVEIWKINPALTSNDGIVDPFSLALSYKEDDDPRVEAELNSIINSSLSED